MTTLLAKSFHTRRDLRFGQSAIHPWVTLGWTVVQDSQSRGSARNFQRDFFFGQYRHCPFPHCPSWFCLPHDVNFDGIVNDVSVGTCNCSLGMTWWRSINSPDILQKSSLASTGSRSRVIPCALRRVTPRLAQSTPPASNLWTLWRREVWLCAWPSCIREPSAQGHTNASCKCLRCSQYRAVQHPQFTSYPMN